MLVLKKGQVLTIVAISTIVLNGCSSDSDNSTIKDNQNTIEDQNITEIKNGDEINHDGFLYKAVESPITGRIWLDRNLGASSSCTKSREDSSFSSDEEYISNQESCFGDLYQWGRLTDGHEKTTSSTSNTEATSIKLVGGDFITADEDWLNVDNDIDTDGNLRTDQWSKTDGTSVCPEYFRVPTSQELYAETTSAVISKENNSTGAIKVVDIDSAHRNFLKLPASGYRIGQHGAFSSVGSYGILWTSTRKEDKSYYMDYDATYASENTWTRSDGYSVRCILD
jgi:uncharacterized protein (TIGR02145 family)